MQTAHFTDVTAFLDVARAHLESDLPRNQLILGIAGSVAAHPAMYAEYHAWVVTRGTDVAVVASCTPPWNYVVGDSDDVEAVVALVAALTTSGLGASGVVGNRPTVDRLAGEWSAATGQAANIEMSQGVFSLETLEPVDMSPGRARPATADDRDVLARWWLAFLEESHAGGEATARFASERVDQRLGAGDQGIDVWESDGEVVSMSGYAAVLNSMRIGPVYTPPELRGRGYATSLVHDQSRRAIEAGRDHCLLYTDLDNPTSNAIYRRIGYHQVAESRVYGFEPEKT